MVRLEMSIRFDARQKGAKSRGRRDRWRPRFVIECSQTHDVRLKCEPSFPAPRGRRRPPLRRGDPARGQTGREGESGARGRTARRVGEERRCRRYVIRRELRELDRAQRRTEQTDGCGQLEAAQTATRAVGTVGVRVRVTRDERVQRGVCRTAGEQADDQRENESDQNPARPAGGSANGSPTGSLRAVHARNASLPRSTTQAAPTH